MKILVSVLVFQNNSKKDRTLVSEILLLFAIPIFAQYLRTLEALVLVLSLLVTLRIELVTRVAMVRMTMGMTVIMIGVLRTL